MGGPWANLVVAGVAWDPLGTVKQKTRIVGQLSLLADSVANPNSEQRRLGSNAKKERETVQFRSLEDHDKYEIRTGQKL